MDEAGAAGDVEDGDARADAWAAGGTSMAVDGRVGTSAVDEREREEEDNNNNREDERHDEL